MANASPVVSVVIPTLNSGKTLKTTLDSIRKQTYRNLDVIVVDGGSTDNTVSVAREYQEVRLFGHTNERSAQFNYGARQATGEYIYRVDSDFYLEPTVVEEAVLSCLNGATAVLIHNTSDPTIGFWSRVRKLERDCYIDSEINVAIRFMRLSDFFRVGGFLVNLVAAEDYDLHNRLLRLGVRVARIRAQEIHLGEPRTLAEVVRKHVYYGKHIGDFVKANPRSYWLQISPIRMAYFRHWRSFTRDPLVTLGFFLYQYIRYSSAFVGYLADYARRGK